MGSDNNNGILDRVIVAGQSLQRPFGHLDIVRHHLGDVERRSEGNVPVFQRFLPGLKDFRPEFLIEWPGIGEEGSGQNGVAHQTADLFFEGSALQSPAQFLSAESANQCTRDSHLPSTDGRSFRQTSLIGHSRVILRRDVVESSFLLRQHVLRFGQLCHGGR